MSETYPLRAPGDYAGTKCQLKVCPKYSRFLVFPTEKPDDAKAVCAIHLAAVVRTMHLLTGQAVIIQEIPGNWGRELIVADNQLALLGTPAPPTQG